MSGKIKLEIVIKILAWVEIAFAVMEFFGGIFALVAVTDVSAAVNRLSANSTKSPKLVEADMQLNRLVLMITIKMIYLIILFFVSEALLAGYLLRAVQKKCLASLQIWLIVATVYASLYVTDFLSTIHASSVFEETSVTLGIFIKVPLLILVFMYRRQLSKDHGDNLVNEAI